MLAKVHIAAKELRLSPEAYGDVLLRVTGQESAAGLSDAELHKLLGEFRRLGWKGGRPVSAKPNVRLVFALWGELRPYLADPSVAALRQFCRRQTHSPATPDGVSAPEFLNPKQANLVVEGLKAWLAREKRKRSAERAGAAPAEVRP